MVSRDSRAKCRLGTFPKPNSQKERRFDLAKADDFRITDMVEKDLAKEERHVTGQELCEAVRRFALEQYGYMARMVLANWGIHATADVGELVFNLIRIRQMRKTPHDRREDFHDVYDFKTAFQEDFRFTPSEPPPPDP